MKKCIRNNRKNFMGDIRRGEDWMKYDRRLSYRARVGKLFAAAVALLILAIWISVSCYQTDAFASGEQAPRYKYFTVVEVKSGDSLWDLAGRYLTEEYADRDAYIEEVLTTNHMGDADEIYTGQTLTLPYYSSELK